MRLINRPLAFLLAAFLLVASVLLIVEVIGYAITAKPVLVHWTTWYSWAGKTEWKAGVIRFWAVVLIIIGLVLLYLELRPAQGFTDRHRQRRRQRRRRHHAPGPDRAGQPGGHRCGWRPRAPRWSRPRARSPSLPMPRPGTRP